MTTTQIEYFLITAECENIQTASEKLYVSRQAISKQIKAIETELGVELFERSTKRGVTLTDAGKMLYECWAELYPKHKDALRQIEQFKKRKTHTIIVGLENTQIKNQVIDLFQSYMQLHSDVVFEYKIDSPERIVKQFEDETIDIAILLSLSLKDVNKCQHLVMKHHIDRPVIAMSKKHPLADKITSLQDLKNETFILIDASFSKAVVERQKKDFEANRFKPNNIKMVSNLHELLVALSLNQGVAFIHEMLLDEVKDKVKTFPIITDAGNESYDTLILWKQAKHEALAKEIIKIYEKQT